MRTGGRPGRDGARGAKARMSGTEVPASWGGRALTGPAAAAETRFQEINQRAKAMARMPKEAYDAPLCYRSRGVRPGRGLACGRRPAAVGFDVLPQHGAQPAGRAEDLLPAPGRVRAPQGRH